MAAKFFKLKTKKNPSLPGSTGCQKYRTENFYSSTTELEKIGKTSIDDKHVFEDLTRMAA